MNVIIRLRLRKINNRQSAITTKGLLEINNNDPEGIRQY